MPGTSPGMTTGGGTCGVSEPTNVVKARVHMGFDAKVEFKPDTSGSSPGMTMKSVAANTTPIR